MPYLLVLWVCRWVEMKMWETHPFCFSIKTKRVSFDRNKEETLLANKLILRMLFWKYLLFTPRNYTKYCFTVISFETGSRCILSYWMEVQGYPLWWILFKNTWHMLKSFSSKSQTKTGLSKNCTKFRKTLYFLRLK